MALDLTVQLYELDGHWECVDWWQAGESAAIGALLNTWGTAGYAGRYGREWVSKSGNWRWAPWGNSTTHSYGKWPHYHRRGTGPGQGIKRHRPFEPKSTDTSWWDRF